MITVKHTTVKKQNCDHKASTKANTKPEQKKKIYRIILIKSEVAYICPKNVKHAVDFIELQLDTLIITNITLILYKIINNKHFINVSFSFL